MKRAARRGNPSWAYRPEAREWEPHEDDLLIQLVTDGCAFEFMPALFPARLPSEILARRLELVKAGLVRMRDPL